VGRRQPIYDLFPVPALKNEVVFGIKALKMNDEAAYF
jgi:hypothetical protein